MRNRVVFLRKTKITKRFLVTIYTWKRTLVKLHQKIRQKKVNQNYLKNIEKYKKSIPKKIYFKVFALLNRRNAKFGCEKFGNNLL